MPQPIKLAIIILTVVPGCMTAGRIENAKRIEISYYSGSSTPHCLVTSGNWVLLPSGGCTGRGGQRMNADDFDTTATYTLPPQVFDECKNLLAKTRFFQMRAGGDALPGGSSRSITVSCDGHQHSVSVVGGATAPAGFAELEQFVCDLPVRGKQVTSAPSPR